MYGPQGWSAHSEEEKNLLTMQGTEPRFLSCPPRGPVVRRCLFNTKFHLSFTVQTSQPQKSITTYGAEKTSLSKLMFNKQLQFSFKFWTDLTSIAHEKSQPMKTMNPPCLNIFKYLSESFLQLEFANTSYSKTA